MKKMHHYKVLSRIILAIITLLSTMPKTHAQNLTMIQEERMKVAGITTDGMIYNLSPDQKQITRVYYDGLGRPVQQMAVKASPLQKDIVQAIAYDVNGNQPVSYLPYVAADGTGIYRPNAISSEQPSFYNNGKTDKVADDSMPFSRQVIENSPLQRILQAGSVGTGFQPGEHYSSVNYRSNNSAVDGNIIVWLPDGTRSGSYADNALSVTEATDPDGKKARVYADKGGRTILKRQVLDAAHNIDTYYIYNTAGGLSYAIPPKAVKLLTDNPAYTLSQTGVISLIYKYVYDDRGRLMQKTIPGSGDLYVIYDPLDRPVLLQDANLRTTNKWNFIKYDAQGRAVIQGYYTDATHLTQASMQSYVDNLTDSYSAIWFESRSSNSATGYYTNSVFPATGTTLLACSYYDDYDLNYDASHVADYTYSAQSLTGEATPTSFVRGMPTMTRALSVGSGMSATWFTKVIFYDKRGNAIQVQSNNQLVATMSDVATVVPDFTGMPLQTKVQKFHAASTSTTVLSTFSYDHMYRVTAVKQKYNTGTETTVATYAYNEMGQPVDKKLGINGSAFLQSVDYRYNIRGQLLSINNSKLADDHLDANANTNDDANDVFGEEMLYNQSSTQIGSTGTYGGNLSAVKWMSLNGSNVKSNERSYRYSYDALGRFTQALYAERLSTAAPVTNFTLNPGGFDEKGITYDENGNILSLQRNSSTVGGSGGTTIDNLTYAYDSANLNKLLTVTDASSAAAGFRNYTGNSTSSYTYDGAGNLTADPYKGISSITYNVLNRVDRVTLTYPSPATNGRYIDYTYEATGKLIRKQQYDNSTLIKTTDYIDGFIYTTAGAGAAQLDYFAMPEGRVRNTGTGGTITLKQEFVLTDHQGNARISFEDNGSGAALVKQENSYYAFGMSMTSTMSPPTSPNKNLYNGGSEWQNDYDNQPDWQQTFYRNYDATIGRFLAVDPMAEASDEMTVYQYAGNNPIMMNDPMGDLQMYGGRQKIQNYSNGSDPGFYDSWQAEDSGWAYAQRFFVENGFGDFRERFGSQTLYNRTSMGPLTVNEDGRLGYYSDAGIGYFNPDHSIKVDENGVDRGNQYVIQQWNSLSLKGSANQGGDPYEYIGSQKRAYSMSEFINANKGLTRTEIINQLDNRSKSFLNSQQGGPAMRYVRNPHDGKVLDMRHMLIVGKLPTIVGNLLEVGQWLDGQPSGMNPQDFYSNNVGYQFYMQYSGILNYFYPREFTNQLQNFFNSPRIIIMY